MKKIILALLLILVASPVYADGRHERHYRRESPQENAYRQMDGFYRDYHRFYDRRYDYYRLRNPRFYYPGLYFSLPYFELYWEDDYDDYYDYEGE